MCWLNGGLNALLVRAWRIFACERRFDAVDDQRDHHQYAEYKRHTGTPTETVSASDNQKECDNAGYGVEKCFHGVPPIIVRSLAPSSAALSQSRVLHFGATANSGHLRQCHRMEETPSV